MNNVKSTKQKTLETRINNIKDFKPSCEMKLVDMIDDLSEMPIDEYLKNYPYAANKYDNACRRARELTQRSIYPKTYYEAVRLAGNLDFMGSRLEANKRRIYKSICLELLVALSIPFFWDMRQNRENPKIISKEEFDNLHSLSDKINNYKASSKACFKIFKLPVPHYYWAACVRTGNSHIWNVYKNEIRQVLNKDVPDDKYSTASIAAFVYELNKECEDYDNEDKDRAFSLLKNLIITPLFPTQIKN